MRSLTIAILSTFLALTGAVLPAHAQVPDLEARLAVIEKKAGEPGQYKGDRAIVSRLWILL